jgi:hypothetical protein
VAALYARGAVFRSEPFREVQDPRAYAEWAFASERGEPDPRFAPPHVAADGRAAVEYWAVVRDESGESTIAGVALLRFDEDGLVVEQRDYWNESEGHRERPPGAGA